MILLMMIWEKIKLYVLAAGAVLAVLGGVYVKGRRDQSESATAAENTQKLKDLEAQKEIHNEVSQMPDADLDRALARFVRPDKK